MSVFHVSRKGNDEEKSAAGRRWRRAALAAILIAAAVVYVPGNIRAGSLQAEAKTYISTGLQRYKNVGTLGVAKDSYIVKEGDYYMIVKWMNNADYVYVAYYDKDFNFVTDTSVPLELSIFGCFYTDGNNYYIVSGNNNFSNDNSVECFRVTKYDKGWNVLGHCGLSNCDTNNVFGGGSCRAAMVGDYLFVRTSHGIYSGHETNFTLSVNTKTMTLSDSVYGYGWQRLGYVSHSFNEFVLNDNGKLVMLDIGDAYPRALVLTTATGMADGDLRRGAGRSRTTQIQKFRGDTGDNYVGADAGGIAIGSSSYLVAYRMIHQDTDEEFNQDSTANVFLAAVSRDDGKVTKIRQLSNFDIYTGDGASCPQIVPIGNDQFVVLWQPGGRNPYWADLDTWNQTGIVYYQIFDGNGDPIGAAKAATGMNLCHDVPIYDDGQLIWFEMDGNGAVTFHTITL